MSVLNARMRARQLDAAGAPEKVVSWSGALERDDQARVVLRGKSAAESQRLAV